ncbi:hypothetical protein AB1Y20_006601 [Prymnesium parvum]|uniref:GOLD domain-containing protein n=1 Tax=Prymnesium parvum TaxID=97485 RepID=A0AB34IYW2_PRYPA
MRWAQLLLLAPAARGFSFDVPTGKVECFQELANASDHVAGDWQVSRHKDDAELLTLDVQVTSPDGNHVYKVESEMSGAFDYFATVEGVYSFCFSNRDGPPKKVVAKIGVGEPPDLIQLAKTEHLTPIEERIKNLHESMNAVRDLQDQLRDQDEAHDKMSRSTKSWLLYFTMLEAIVLVAVSLWQILYLRSFFEVKRVV